MREILDEMHSNGISIDSLILDAKIHKEKADRSDHKKSIWYIGFQNYSKKDGTPFYVVKYGNFRTGEEFQYQSKNSSITTEEKKLIREQIENSKRKAEEEKRILQDQTAKEVEEKWRALPDGGPRGAYLNRKEIDSLFNAKSYIDPISGVSIIVPMRDVSNKIWSWQKINEDGSKYFYAGGKVQGCYHVIGEEKDAIYICEGFATAASIFTATGRAVVCAFNSGNLEPVATALKKKYPEKEFIICGDDDRDRKKNVGRIKAEEAAKAVGGRTIYPVFLNPKEKDTDFNDLHVAEGVKAVREQLERKEIVVSRSEEDIVNTPYPDTTDKLKPKATMVNLTEMLRRLGIIVRYNIISKEEEILVPGLTSSIDNRANSAYAHITDWCVRVGIGTENLSQFLTSIADRNLYNPVGTWIGSNPWDKVSRAQEFYDTIRSVGETKDNTVKVFKETLLKTWMISCVAAACEPDGIAGSGVLVLQGKQYVGKTKWFKMLVPQDMNLTADGVILRPDDKDSVFQVVSKWLVELGELDATFRKADIAQLKAFLTKQKDTIRRPYAKKESTYARRTAFFASVNDEEFLKDLTGNRRFWTIAVEWIDFNHKLDMQQVWAEFAEMYKNGASWYLDEVEMQMLNHSNQQFEETNPIEERILAYFNWDSPGTVKMTATEVCQKIGISNPEVRHTRAAGAAIRKITGRQPSKKGSPSYYDLPSLTN